MKKIFMLFLFFLAMTACSPQPGEDCSKPVAAYEYPLIEPDAAYKSIKTTEGPGRGWEFISKIPDHIEKEILFAKDGNIWIGGMDALEIYNQESKSWVTITSASSIIPRVIYKINGRLWGVDSGKFRPNSSIVSIYSTKDDRFDEINDNSNLLNGLRSVSLLPKSVLDSDGSLWFSLQDPSDKTCWLYSFDTISLKAKKHILLDEYCHTDIAVTKDGKIWFYDESGNILKWYKPESKQTGSFEDVKIQTEQQYTSGFHSINNFYTDRNNNLWVDDRGFLDLSNPEKPIWHKVIRSNVFITDEDPVLYQIGWDRPYSTYQSSDMSYWFTDHQGIVHLSPETGTWCRFTSSPSQVVEDEKGNIWIMVFDKLYRHKVD
jgi:ligand-binding sensor domain-containing protein